MKSPSRLAELCRMRAEIAEHNARALNFRKTRICDGCGGKLKTGSVCAGCWRALGDAMEPAPTRPPRPHYSRCDCGRPGCHSAPAMVAGGQGRPGASVAADGWAGVGIILVFGALALACLWRGW